VVTIGSIHGGSAGNIIPDQVQMRGTIRFLDTATQDAVMASVERIASHTAQAFNGSAETTFSGALPPLVNDERMTEFVIAVAARTLGSENVVRQQTPDVGAEDFSFYLQHAPGAFFSLGLKEEGRPCAALHNAAFDFNDNAIQHGVSMFVSIAREFLGR